MRARIEAAATVCVRVPPSPPPQQQRQHAHNNFVSLRRAQASFGGPNLRSRDTELAATLSVGTRARARASSSSLLLALAAYHARAQRNLGSSAHAGPIRARKVGAPMRTARVLRVQREATATCISSSRPPETMIGVPQRDARQMLVSFVLARVRLPV